MESSKKRKASQQLTPTRRSVWSQCKASTARRSNKENIAEDGSIVESNEHITKVSLLTPTSPASVHSADVQLTWRIKSDEIDAPQHEPTIQSTKTESDCPISSKDDVAIIALATVKKDSSPPLYNSGQIYPPSFWHKKTYPGYRRENIALAYDSTGHLLPSTIWRKQSPSTYTRYKSRYDLVYYQQSHALPPRLWRKKSSSSYVKEKLDLGTHITLPPPSETTAPRTDTTAPPTEDKNTLQEASEATEAVAAAEGEPQA